jgi:oxalate decarboxylase/phosphoglucose isomerase-like protein (cupin superfamily)
MAKDALVSDKLAKNFAKEKDSPYARWVASEGLDIIAAHYIPDLNTVELKPWERRGGRGVFINHEASRTSNDCYVCEIPAGGKLAPQRQLFEEMIMILSGHGSTSVWNDAGAKVTFEWGQGSLFAIPLNTWFQHFNGSGIAAARFVSSTNMPPILNQFDEPEFVFNTPHDFLGRFNGEPDYFANKDELEGLLLKTNFVADAVNLPLPSAKERGAGGGHVRFMMAKGSMNSHISQFPVETYKKGHRHGPGAHVIVMTGEGFSLMWPEGEEPKRYDWKPGTLIVPPNMWFHQHFNAGTTPARYLAFKHEVVSIRNAQGVPKAWISRRIGGDQIDYVDELPIVRETFAKVLSEKGLTPAMDAAYAAELEDLPPLAGDTTPSA